MAFVAPIPGQSLTDEPQNHPWERPPETVDPREAAMKHVERLNKPDIMESVIFMLQMGLPVETMTKTIVTGAVANGIHTLDVGLIIAPIIHEEIVSIANDAGIDYKEAFSNDADKAEEQELKVKALIKAKLGTAAAEEVDPAFVQETVQEMDTAELPEEPVAEETMEEPAPTGKGLMSRKV